MPPRERAHCTFVQYRGSRPAGEWRIRPALTGLLCLLLSLGGCGAVRDKAVELYLEPSPPGAPEGVLVFRDIPFAGTPERTLYLDVYVPESAQEQPLPVILFVFGGAWKTGNRHQLTRFSLQDYALEGFGVVTADYRYLQEATFPAQIEDVLAALRWIRESGGTYGLDARRIGVMGPSAGGHLAALAGTINRPEEAARIGPDVQAGAVQAVVDYFGPTDFLAADDQIAADVKPWSAPDSTVSRLIGAPLKEAPERVQLANPITYIDGTEPPFLLIHGDDDDIVPLAQSELLQEALLAAGVESELLVVRGGGHGSGGDFNSGMPAGKTLQFFRRHLQGED